jgi:hypothetical protein
MSNRLMLFKGVIIIYCENHIKYLSIQALQDKKAEFLAINVDGKSPLCFKCLAVQATCSYTSLLETV